MNTVNNKIKRIMNQIKGLIPTAVPVGMSEFQTWADSILDTYPLPADSDSIKFSLATVIMHLGPTAAYRSKFYFFLVLRAGMAKQVAGAVFQDIKLKQMARLKAEQEATQVQTAADNGLHQ